MKLLNLRKKFFEVLVQPTQRLFSSLSLILSQNSMLLSSNNYLLREGYMDGRTKK